MFKDENSRFVKSKVAPGYYINRAGDIKDSNGQLVKLTYMPISGYFFRSYVKNSRGVVQKTYNGNPKTKSYYVHRLLGQQFLEIPEELKNKSFKELAILFKDTDSKNYDLDNLYIDTRSNNNRVRFKENNSGHCTSVKAKNVVTGKVIEYYSIAECARAHKVRACSLEKILHRDKLFSARVGDYLFRKSNSGTWPNLSKGYFESLRQLKILKE